MSMSEHVWTCPRCGEVIEEVSAHFMAAAIIAHMNEFHPYGDEDYVV